MKAGGYCQRCRAFEVAEYGTVLDYDHFLIWKAGAQFALLNVGATYGPDSDDTLRDHYEAWVEEKHAQACAEAGCQHPAFYDGDPVAVDS